MARIAIPTTTAQYHSSTPERSSLAGVSPLPNLLIVLIFAIDLLTPLLIWKGVIPSSIRWLADIAVIAILGILLLRMLAFNQFPLGFWLIAGLAIISMTQATLQGQPFVATLWGWWRTFQLPLFAVFAYLNPHWPKKFPQLLRQVCVALLVVELLVQILQYVTGEPVGDNLAGTLGRNGVSPLLIFSVFTLSLTLGYGAIRGDWRSFLLAFGAGVLSSSLAENKIFPFAALLLSIFAIGLYVWLGGKFWKLMPYLILIFAGLIGFFVTYNYFVPAAERRPLEQFIFDEGTREQYNQNIRIANDGSTSYDIGRNFAMEFGWNFIRTHSDPSVLLFGLGLGAKTESVSLGIIGIAFEQDGLGFTTGTGLMVLLQEMGLMGIGAVLLFVAVITHCLLKDLRIFRSSVVSELRIGILIFTWLWPVWLWYKPFLWYRETMVLYWIVLGYLFYHRKYDQLVADQDEVFGFDPNSTVLGPVKDKNASSV